MAFVVKSTRTDKWRVVLFTSQLIVLAIVLNGVVVNGQLASKGDENCETLQTEIHLLKGIQKKTNKTFFSYVKPIV
jgi:hypothetical protein